MEMICCKEIKGFTIGKLYKMISSNLSIRKTHAFDDFGFIQFVKKEFFCTIEEWRIIEINKIIDNGNDML